MILFQILLLNDLYTDNKITIVRSFESKLSGYLYCVQQPHAIIIQKEITTF